MYIKINNKVIELPNELMTIKDLLEWQNINENGTAVAVNGHLAERTKWPLHKLNPDDDVVIISAAFGG